MDHVGRSTGSGKLDRDTRFHLGIPLFAPPSTEPVSLRLLPEAVSLLPLLTKLKAWGAPYAVPLLFERPKAASPALGSKRGIPRLWLTLVQAESLGSTLFGGLTHVDHVGCA